MSPARKDGEASFKTERVLELAGFQTLWPRPLGAQSMSQRRGTPSTSRSARFFCILRNGAGGLRSPPCVTPKIKQPFLLDNPQTGPLLTSTTSSLDLKSDTRTFSRSDTLVSEMHSLPEMSSWALSGRFFWRNSWRYLNKLKDGWKTPMFRLRVYLTKSVMLCKIWSVGVGDRHTKGYATLEMDRPVARPEARQQRSCVVTSLPSP